MRLRNRIVKASYYTDPDLCRMLRAKREFYRSLWAVAEDSCCLEDDMFGVKIAAWPSPLDADMSVESFEAWRDELLAENKLIRYEAEGNVYLYIPAMAQHEQPRNPQHNDEPLPPWVEWISNASDLRKGKYVHNINTLMGCTTHQNEDSTVPALPCPDLSCPELPRPNAREEAFERFYKAMPKHAAKHEASITFNLVVASGLDAEILVASASLYAASVRDTERRWIKTPHRYLRDETYLDFIPKPVRVPCSNPACVNGHVPVGDGDEWTRCPDCNGGAS